MTLKLFRALVHGLVLPSEILKKPALSPRLVEILTPLQAFENQSDESLDFLNNYRELVEKPEIDRLIISNRIDLSELELAYLFKLAELGVQITFEFPVDSSGQGLSLPVTYLAQRIEKHHDLKNIEVIFKSFVKPERLVRYEAPDLVQEARFVAQVIAGYDSKNIAVAMRVLDKRALIFRDALRAHGLETPVLALPDLLGKQFDLVVIADCVHGRLTLSREPDWPLRDSDCFEINRLMGRQVLRRFEEDPLEPSLFPARQALEPMWFLGACSAAKLLVLTSSALDEKGQAQTTSEVIKLEWLGKDEGISKLNRPLSQLEQIFQNSKPHLPTLKLRQASPQYQLDKEQFRKQFGDLLGLNPNRSLSATRIEAFAHCRFKAFIERLLKIDLNPPSTHDIDARVIGQLAHEALEKFYRDGQSIQVTLSLADPKDMHSGIWRATLLWLFEALERMVSNLEKNPPVENAKPVYFEHKPEPFKLEIGSDLIHIGGVIDRVDKTPEAEIVVDYKLSALSALRMRFASKEILKTHFQIPIYLKLMSSDKQLLGYPISIRDGAPGPLIDMSDRLPELEQALQTLLEPVLNGYVPADVQTSCSDCRLKRVCRV
ncbi:MAG: PD-(D/E)XK nuclease family protein [Myxococcaceae bacterium]